MSDPDHQSLELCATRALASGDALLAFELADRRCRTPPEPEARSYLLRGEASFRRGDRKGAVSDVARALLLAPEDVAANRRMLLWAEGPDQIRAAEILIRVERDVVVLRKAIELLRNAGRSGFASVVALEDVVEGWAAWDEDCPIEVEISDGAEAVRIRFASDPSWKLGEALHARRFQAARPRSSRAQSIVVCVAGRALCSIRVAGCDAVAASTPRAAERVGASGGVTIVIPVYGDFEATRACLESVCDELERVSSCRLVVVNDASPDPQIAGLLAGLAKAPRTRVIVNDRNLGFVGAVNRALHSVCDGDVVLLNADTIVPPGFVDRLAAVAAAHADVGIVMPLSNNADLASFPIPYSASPVGSRAEVERIDAIAANVNAGRLVDIPNAIGFCLYLTRACIEAVGVLSEDFDRGYLEDVDYSLRARKRGFRVVCAPSVYVGHSGSKSFGMEKRSLVVRNQRKLHARHRDYNLQFAAFGAADPLREFRRAIERELVPEMRNTRLLIAGAGAVGAIARSRGRRLAAAGHSVLTLEIRDGSCAALSDPAGSQPLSAEFDLASPAECDALIAFLRKSSVSRIEILDPRRLPLALFARLRELDVPYEMVIADAGLLGPVGAATLLAANASFQAREPFAASEAAWVERWREIVAGAGAIVALDRQAQAFATRLFPDREVQRSYVDDPRPPRRVSRPGVAGAKRLGLLPVRLGADEQRLIGEIDLEFRRSRPDFRLVVLGAALDDLALMRGGDLHVTGPIEAADLERVAASCGLDFLFVSVTQPLFGHPLVSQAFAGSRPVAYFDWSNGAVPGRMGDLPLDPRLSAAAVATRLQLWLDDRSSARRRPRKRPR